MSKSFMFPTSEQKPKKWRFFFALYIVVRNGSDWCLVLLQLLFPFHCASPLCLVCSCARVCVFVRCVAHLFFFLLINGSARQSDLFYTFVLSSFCIIELSFNDKICAASRPLALSLPPPLCPRVYHCMWVCRIIAITIILKLLQVWRNSLR